jgi:hypothetical protein
MALVLVTACRPQAATADPGLQAATEQRSPIGIHDALEALIQSGAATEDDRKYAYEAVLEWDDGSAEYAFVRGALAGRLAQARGLAAVGLVKESETWAKTSIERDRNYADGAARRMLGTLYVLAGDYVEHGDSEEGLELLEELVEEHPDQIVNWLRMAEGYVALGDPEGGFEGLCTAQAGKDQLTGEEAELLTHLIEDAGGQEELGCDASS